MQTIVKLLLKRSLILSAEGEKEGLTEASMDTIRFDMKSQNRKKSAEISNVIAEMEAFGLVDGEKGDTEDLLDLMDKAN